MRAERDTAVLFVNEAAYGVDQVPVAATDAMLLRKFQCDDEYKFVKNPELRSYFGSSKDILGYQFVTGSFEVALSSGFLWSTKIPPMWGRILRAGGFAEVVTSPELTAPYVDYTLLSELIESGTMYYYDSGSVKKALGVRVNITGIKFGYGDIPTLACSFIGLDGGEAEGVTPSVVLAQWVEPLAVNKINSGLLTIGGAFLNDANGCSITGGTTYASKGIEVSLGSQMAPPELLGGESVDITNRDVTGKITVDLTAAQEINFKSLLKFGTTDSLGLVHGAATTGLLAFLPNIQYTNIKRSTLNGRRVFDIDFKSIPTPDVGNDELRIVVF